MNKKVMLALSASALLLAACGQMKDDAGTKNTVNESVVETVKETVKETLKEVKVKQEGKEDNGAVIEVITNDASVAKTFDLKLQKQMLEKFKNDSVVLISGNDTTMADFPKENIQPVKEISSDVWEGYFVRFGDKKAGILARVKKSVLETVNLYDLKLEEKIKEDNVATYNKLADQEIEKFLKSQE